jgi:hypothetical protein
MHEHLIVSPAKEHMSKTAVMDGIVNSAMLSPTQRREIDGLVTSAIPDHKKPKHRGGADIPTFSVKASATRGDIGARHFGGSPYR